MAAVPFVRLWDAPLFSSECDLSEIRTGGCDEKESEVLKLKAQVEGVYVRSASHMSEKTDGNGKIFTNENSKELSLEEIRDTYEMELSEYFEFLWKKKDVLAMRARSFGFSDPNIQEYVLALLKLLLELKDPVSPQEAAELIIQNFNKLPQCLYVLSFYLTLICMLQAVVQVIHKT